MNQVEFQYKDTKINIICNINDKMKDIIRIFFYKVDAIENNVYFLYEGEILDEELTFTEASKQKNKMTIVVMKVGSEIGYRINNLQNLKKLIM